MWQWWSLTPPSQQLRRISSSSKGGNQGRAGRQEGQEGGRCTRQLWWCVWLSCGSMKGGGARLFTKLRKSRGSASWCLCLMPCKSRMPLCCAVPSASCRPGLSKTQQAEISVQVRELYTKAIKQQAATGLVGPQLPPLMPPGGAAADSSSKGWKFWKS